jgi:hypothetical protein
VTDADPVLLEAGRVAGVAYWIDIVHVALGASGTVYEHVVAVMLNSPERLLVSDSAVICKFPVPVLVMVTVLVTDARGVGIVKVSVRTPTTVLSVPFVAEVKLSVPCSPVPLIATGAPFTGTLAAMFSNVLKGPPAVGVNLTEIVQLAPANRVPELQPLF